jgi:preprotein translocase subunit SecD
MLDVTDVLCVPGGECDVLLRVRESHRSKVAQWSAERIGQYAGVFVDGALVYVSKIMAEIRYQIGIAGFSTAADAEAVANAVRNGGRGDRSP